MLEILFILVILAVGMMIGGFIAAHFIDKTVQFQQNKKLDFDNILKWKEKTNSLDKEADWLATWLSAAYVDSGLLPNDVDGMPSPQPDQIREYAQKQIKTEKKK